ncbi:CRISPR-associated endonuclease Cas2 [Haemophilus parahaemolyticus]|uniref:CRISPR-associated endoribonuclease Cas2 n=1 Tax=Haemophilus parahaemolyticus TaxID=735 RepID=A0A369ZCL1_HAEPH|nr:CRISPR-associated endonuclease Cas2 [Haemophilus parahaemolyticus]MCG5125910.1 CRISPR-associated endonuclease Cas2 [Candidatus Saccharibacteria bacterium]RDF00374.1 CRISPR-associated endonuclease Cas2 [Haemophilus parahaemolyticus]
MDTRRSRYLIAYDIADSHRLYQMHKHVEAFAIGGQKSFYECWLTEHEMMKFKQEVNALIDPSDDCVFIFRIPDNIEPWLFGKAELQSISPFMLV